MAQPLPMRAPAHYLRVDLDDPAEAEYWQVIFDCDRSRLETAVAAVGSDALEVRAWIEGRLAAVILSETLPETP